MIQFKHKDLARTIHEANKAKGFWEEEVPTGTLLMMVTSELGEAMDAVRSNKFSNYEGYSADSIEGGRQMEEEKIKPGSLEHHDRANQVFMEAFKANIKDTYEDEIADAMIRLYDLAGAQNIDLDFHISQKLKFNSLRPKKHGKEF